MGITLTGILLFIAALCGIVTLILYHVKRLHLYREAAKFKGPPVLPIIGNGHYFLGNTVDLLNKLLSLMATYPSPFRAWLGSRLYFLVYDVDCIKTILNSPKSIEKDRAYKFTQPYVGTGLLTAPAAKWRVNRKLIQPTFNQRILDSFVDIFAKRTEIMKRKMRNEVNKGEIDIYNYISRCTFDFICDTAMGVCLNVQTEKENRYFNSTNRLAQIMYLRIFKIWLHPDLLFTLTKLGKDHDKYVEYLSVITDEVIEKKMNAYKNSTRVANDTTAPERGTTKKAFLDLLIELSNEGAILTNKEIRDEVQTMLVAGSDTTATTGSFVLMMLANYPEIQEKVYQELYEIYGDEIGSDTPVQKEDLKRMEYMERVVKETLRLFPPGPIVARSITDDINIGDRTLPKGSGVVIGIMHMHRCEKYWPDPLKFDPDRFLPEEVAKRDPYSYLPFSGGPRACVGSVYAMMSMKFMFATLLRHYVFKKDEFFKIEDLKLKAEVVLKPMETMTLKITERRKTKSKNQ